MTFTLPNALLDSDDSQAVALLEEYFGPRLGDKTYFTGSAFDAWDGEGTQGESLNRFTADDLVAITFLSVEVPGLGAQQLLGPRSEEFTALLTELGEDRDLVEESEPLTDDWAGWKLMEQLRTLPGVGPTTASKLLARKRPKLRPIFDKVVAKVTGTQDQQWEPLRLALRANDGQLHQRLLRIRDAAGLDDSISALRVLDVIAWREGKKRGL